MGRAVFNLATSGDVLVFQRDTAFDVLKIKISGMHVFFDTRKYSSFVRVSVEVGMHVAILINGTNVNFQAKVKENQFDHFNNFILTIDLLRILQLAREKQ